MSIVSAQPVYRERADVLHTLSDAVVRWRKLILSFALGFPVFFYFVLLAILTIRYSAFPNYITPYNWPENVWHIIQSTKSVRDMIPIIGDEWLLEVGRMNYSYGHGIADWSMAIVPHKLLMIALTGALIGLNVGLISDRQASGSLFRQCAQACGTGLLTSTGALSASITSSTIYSVACCATPSWVGSLSVLGLETSSAFALEPYGLTALILGVSVLLVSAAWLAHGVETQNLTKSPARPQ